MYSGKRGRTKLDPSKDQAVGKKSITEIPHWLMLKGSDYLVPADRERSKSFITAIKAYLIITDLGGTSIVFLTSRHLCRYPVKSFCRSRRFRKRESGSGSGKIGKCSVGSIAIIDVKS